MTKINRTTARQFLALAPETFKALGKTWKIDRRQILVIDAQTIQVAYKGRKQRGAFLADKVVFEVGYGAGYDLYSIKASRFDGLALEASDLRSVDAVTLEAFASVPSLVA
jgi:hypothetical protein